MLYPTSDGDEVCRCVWGPEDVDLDGDLPVCPGPADEERVRAAAARRRERAEILTAVREVVTEVGVEMDVLAVDVIDDDFDRTVAVYFRAPHRVEFATIVGPIARRLRARVDLRQLRGRDTARVVGGVGVCGRSLCCTTFLTDPDPVASRLVDQQGMAANPLAVTGACGKLMCCLRYESPYYSDFEAAAGEAVAGESGCPLVATCSTARRRRHDHEG